MRALVVDPDPPRSEALEAELTRQGYAVVHATSSEQALREAAAHDPMLVCLAARIGEDDGLALCRALSRQAGAEERLIVLVAGEHERVAALDAVDAGAVDVWEIPEGGASRLETRLRLAGHYARLQAEHVRVGGEFALLRQALDLTGTGFVLTDPRLDDDPIVYANQAFLELTGYSAEEVIGRNCRFLQGPETDPERVDELRRRLRAQQPVTVELLNHRKDGSAFHNEVHISPVRNERGELVRFVGVQVDVSAYRRQQQLFARERSARAAAEASERRSAFLAEASPLLDASLDLRSTLDSLTRLSVPFLGDVCTVNELRHDEVRRLAAAASDPAVERIVRALPSPYPVGDDDPLARVVRAGRPEILEAAGAGVFGPAFEGLARSNAAVPAAAMVVPLRTRGRTIGALAFASLDRTRRYDADDLVLAEDLASRAALALDNARLYENLGSLARTLQEGLLPDRLPDVDGVELAARFRPAGDGSVIGGDFYDVLPRADGFDLVIGDVTGKGARAAALTGLVRHTLRTAARYEGAPSEVLEVVNATLVAERRLRGRYCTVAFCRVRTGGAVTATMCCAGHPMPMVVRARGDVEPVGRPGSVLGWISDPKLVDVPFALDPGEALVLYTDGVTEARSGTAPPMDGPRLQELLRAGRGDDAAGIAARVERAAARAGAQRDDVAVLVSRVRPAGSA